ncbi:MAG: glycosyltransferase family 4 protein, partial [Anaerolineales bacterium]|nr:glycosyltransferase family 4 protein [Anaerolineales bacterium]
LFYPRRDRVESDAISIHQPELPLRTLSRAGVERRLARSLYRRVQLQSQHRLICMTEFTRTALVKRYGTGHDARVIYPPVDMASFQPGGDVKQRQVVSLGRFVPDKRQLAQIQLAAALPDWPFYIVGFAGNGAYFRQCQALVNQQNIQNAHLHPDAPFAEAQEILSQSRYFLHTLVAEPFGLTAVQAIAAGCVPLVHNSGGQRETVPLPQLRYDALTEIPERLLAIEAMDPAERAGWLAQLQAHAAEKFGADVFDQRIKAVFQEYL